MSTRALLEQWRAQNPQLFGGLKAAIAGPEGTWGKDGVRYNVMYGGGTFNDLSKHPDRVVHGGRYSSAAAGAYQYMPGTWSNVQRAIGADSFSPENQDIGMLHLVRERLKPIGGLAAITKAGGLTPEIVHRLAPEWASLPTLSGRSYHGQPVKSYAEVTDYFNKGKAMAGSGAVLASAPASTPAATTATVPAQPGQTNQLPPGITINITAGKGKEEEEKDPERRRQSFLTAFINSQLMNAPDYYAMASGEGDDGLG